MSKPGLVYLVSVTDLEGKKTSETQNYMRWLVDVGGILINYCSPPKKIRVRQLG